MTWLNDIDASADMHASNGLPDKVTEVLAKVRAYQDTPDPGHVLASLAVAATAHLTEDPVWLLLVGDPSSGKTETVKALSGVAQAHLDDVSAAGFLSWKAGKEPKPTGVLSRLNGQRVLMLIGDLSSLLASSDRGGRDATFALMRKMFDGHVVRDLGSAPAPLMWEGKVTLLGAVTPAIDHYSAHSDALGPRWLYYRMSKRTLAGRRSASRMARRGGLEAHRKALAEACATAVLSAQTAIGDVLIDDDFADAIDDAANTTAYGRGAVPRNSYARREIDGIPVVEEPMRLVRQLTLLARGLLALGLDSATAAALVRRVALDSMPATRHAVLTVLATGELLNTSAIARKADLDRGVARRALEDLEAIGVTRAQRYGTEPNDDSEDRRRADWCLRGDDGDEGDVGDVVAGVFRAAAKDAEWCLNVWGPTPHPPRTDALD